MKKIFFGIFLAFVISLGAAIGVAVVSAVVEIYLAGHGIMPGWWTKGRDWVLLGLSGCTFVVTLIVACK